MCRYVLFGVGKGKEEWQEDVITETSDHDVLRRAQDWAWSQGFTRLRVWDTRTDGRSVPDLFAASVYKGE